MAGLAGHRPARPGGHDGRHERHSDGVHIRALTDLFAPQGQAVVVWASQTRPEPCYYLQRAPDEQARRREILAAVALLPGQSRYTQRKRKTSPHG